MLIRTSKGALQTESAFFIRKRRLESVISASEPKAKVIVARARPMIVRY